MRSHIPDNIRFLRPNVPKFFAFFTHTYVNSCFFSGLLLFLLQGSLLLRTFDWAYAALLLLFLVGLRLWFVFRIDHGILLPHKSRNFFLITRMFSLLDIGVLLFSLSSVFPVALSIRFLSTLYLFLVSIVFQTRIGYGYFLNRDKSLIS